MPKWNIYYINQLNQLIIKPKQTPNMLVLNQNPQKSKSINLNRLKHGIDIRLQAILRYLENEQSLNSQAHVSIRKTSQVTNTSSLPSNILKIDSKISEASNGMGESCKLGIYSIQQPQIKCPQEQVEFESTTANNRQSMDEDQLLHLQSLINVPQRQRNSQPIQSTQLQTIPEKVLINQYLARRKQQKQEQPSNTQEQYEFQPKQIVIVTNEKNVKFCPNVIQLENFSDDKSEQSFSRKNIQQSAYQKIYGVPLTTSLTNNIDIVQPLNFDIKDAKTDIKLIKKLSSGSNTARSIKESKNKQNKQYSSPCLQFSKSKSRSKEFPRVDRKTPYKTPFKSQHSNQCSAAKRLFQHFSGHERAAKPITQELLRQMTQQIEEVEKKTRKQAQDNNVRIKLLKRIQGMRTKGSQFLASK